MIEVLQGERCRMHTAKSKGMWFFPFFKVKLNKDEPVFQKELKLFYNTMDKVNEGITAKWLLLILPLVYAVIINMYSYPKGYDIVRFVNVYHEFTNPLTDFSRILHILTRAPDFLMYLYELFFAKLGVPLEILFFIITYITVFNFLFVFIHYYKQETAVFPSGWMLLMVWITISVPSVLSGIRNIHALSFIALSFLFFRQNKKRLGLAAIYYAGFMHYSCYIFLLYPLYVRKLRFKPCLVPVLISGFLLFCFSFIPSKFYEEILPLSLFHKVDYYLLNNSYLTTKYSLNGLIYNLINWYVPVSYLIFLIYKQYLNITLKKEVVFLFLLCLLFIFFPNVYSRFLMLLLMFAVYNVLIAPRNKWTNLFLFGIFFQFLVEQILFWKTVVSATV